MTDFVAQESGVIIGIPGVGKSHILSQLVVSLVEKNIPACLIKLDSLTNGSDEEIANNLGMPDTDWVANLKTIPSPSKGRSTIAFDAFDTLRDEKLKAIVLQKIAHVKKELPEWSIIVSVRTYDAHQSQKLIELFPSGLSQDSLDCRKFTIPELSDEELNLFLEDNKKLSSLYEVANQRLKDIFKIPFYLKLLDFILNQENADINSLSVIKSEIELLDRYWNKVVGSIKPLLATEVVLRKLTSEMINIKQLSVNKYDFLEKLSGEEILIVDRLLSENVLKETGATQGQLSFAHNILFDYAVSKLILKDSATGLLDFIAVDRARPFFLRPSFIYFFARLWYTDQKTYWEIYDELSRSNDEVIMLFNKLIPSTVIAKEFERTNQLQFLDGTDDYKSQQASNVLQALRFQRDTNNKSAQASMLLKLSENIHLPFLWDLSLILEGLINDPRVKGDTEAYSNCGIAARNIMNFLLANRQDPNIDRLASYRGTSLVTKTYTTDVPASKAILEKILDMLAEPNFNIAYFSSLTEDFKEIYKDDPDFCINAYKRIFEHQENSHDPAPMHGGVLMSFSSSRHDQFNTCHFRLQQLFPKLIKVKPDLAIPLGLSISNSFIDGRNQNGIIIPEAITLPKQFVVAGTNAEFQVDMSHYWSQNLYRTDSVEHTEYIINYFQSLIEAGDEEGLKSGLKIYFEHAKNAYNWKKLLSFGASFPEQLHEHLFGLILQPAILFWDDTIVAAGAFLEAAIPYYNDDQLNQIEQAILSLPGFVDAERAEKADLVVKRLLSRIPKEKLSHEKSIALMADSEPIANEPLVTFHSTSEIVTTEMFLAERGVDVNEPNNEKLLTENSKMELFTRQFSNHVPDMEVYLAPLESAFSSFAEIKENYENLPPRLSQTILTSIASVCTVALHSNLTLSHDTKLSKEQLNTIKEIVLYCLDQYTEVDFHAETNSSPGSGYSSTPRTEASRALPKLFALTKDVELLPLIEQYANDKNSVTRFGVAQSLTLLYSEQTELFWKIINQRLELETDWFTKSTLIYQLDHKKIFLNEADRFLAAYQIAQTDIVTLKEGRNSYLDAFLVIALAFLRFTGDTRIKDLLKDCLKENISIGSDLVFQAFEITEPENFYRDFSDPEDIAKSERILNVLMTLLEMCEELLLSVKEGDPINEKVEQSFKIIDTVIQRIYFSMQVGGRAKQQGFKISREDQERFYFFSKPLLEIVLEISRKLGGGHMQGHSAHYFIEIMSDALRFDARFALASTAEVTKMAAGTNYTFDPSAIREVVKFTERLLADHKSMLLEPDAFAEIMSLLNIYVKSGWPEALDLLWKLDDIFR